MKAIVLGIGLQGKAVIHDLEQSELISEIIAADIDISHTAQYLNRMGYSKTRALKLDVAQEQDLAKTFTGMDIRVVVCMLPIELALTAARAALEAGIPFVGKRAGGDHSSGDGA
jgi:saccharopine dehydrogenase-like NADP-dependent oxidoreductase